MSVAEEQIVAVRAALTSKPQTLADVCDTAKLSLSDALDALTAIRRARKLRRTYDAGRACYVYSATGKAGSP